MIVCFSRRTDNRPIPSHAGAGGCSPPIHVVAAQCSFCMYFEYVDVRVSVYIHVIQTYSSMWHHAGSQQHRRPHRKIILVVQFDVVTMNSLPNIHDVIIYSMGTSNRFGSGIMAIFFIEMHRVECYICRYGSKVYTIDVIVEGYVHMHIYTYIHIYVCRI